jgi:hypothetical protein
VRALQKAGLRKKAQASKPSIRPVLLPTRGNATPSHYLAVVAIAKNEARYLREWIEFQRLMGAERIYLYDNGSTDNSAEVLAPYVADGSVISIPWSTFDAETNPQRAAYAHALCNFGPHFRWMAFIDLDEFLFPATAPDLAAALAGYEDCAGVSVPWFMFGSSGHEIPPPGLVIENYTQRVVFPPPVQLRKLLSWKSIVQPQMVRRISSVHIFDLGEAQSVDEGKSALKIFASTKAAVWQERLESLPKGDLLRLNHYYTRSRSELRQKIERGHFRLQWSDDRRRRVELLEQESVLDETILRFVPELRRRLDYVGIGPRPSRLSAIR